MSGKAAGEDGWGETESEMSKTGEVDSSLSERPEHHRPRRLADWINPTGARKDHSLIDKVYKGKNLEIAWERVKANHGAGGIDGESIEAFGEGLEERLARLHEELRTDKYVPQPVRQQRIPKAGKPGEWRVLGIPTIYDRVCQQALLRLLAEQLRDLSLSGLDFDIEVTGFEMGEIDLRIASLEDARRR